MVIYIYCKYNFYQQGWFSLRGWSSHFYLNLCISANIEVSGFQVLYKIGELLASSTGLHFSKEKVIWNPIKTSKDDEAPWRALYGWVYGVFFSTKAEGDFSFDQSLLGELVPIFFSVSGLLERQCFKWGHSTKWSGFRCTIDICVYELFTFSNLFVGSGVIGLSS